MRALLAFIFHIDCLVAVCQPLIIKLLLTYLLTYYYIITLLLRASAYQVCIAYASGSSASVVLGGHSM